MGFLMGSGIMRTKGRVEGWMLASCCDAGPAESALDPLPTAGQSACRIVSPCLGCVRFRNHSGE